MKKKILIVVCLAFMLCGCTANYNLSIYDEKIVESIDILGNDNVTTQEYIENNLLSLTPSKESQAFDNFDGDKMDGASYYEVSKIYRKELVGLNYKFEFNFKDFYDSSAINKCYEYFNVLNNNGILVISTSKENKCFTNNLNKININIETNYKVIDSNADSNRGNTYSWSISSEDYKDSNIYIKLNTKEKTGKTTEEKEKEEKILKIFTTIGIILLVLVVIIILFLMNKRRKLEND